MHSSVLQFVKDKTTKAMFFKKTVLEVGSYNVNGSVRDQIEDLLPKRYVGIDFIAGRGVDEVVDAENIVEHFGKDSFDTVISTEMLEHAENWRECVNNMKQVTKDYLIITTRGPGFKRHSHPDDFWRYTVADFQKIFKDFDILECIDDTDPNAPGVFFIGRKTKQKPVDLSKIDLEPAPAF